MRYLKKLSLLSLIVIVILSMLSGCSSNKKEEVKKQDQKQSEENLKNISTDELSKNIGKDDWVVVDARINDAYNGWALDGVKRGGHIQNAVDFSSNWIDVDVKDKDKTLDDTLKVKGITSDKNVVVYDANGKDAKKVATFLSYKGFKNVYLYDVKEWANDDNLAMKSYPKYDMIVPASWVKENIDSNNDRKPFKIFEVSWGEEAEDYKKGHIKGAVHINTDEVEEGPVWNRLSDKQLEQFALNNGITKDTTVVLYGADSMAAYRVAAILKYMGVEDARVLNGGYDAWVREGYDGETKVNEKQKVDSFGTTVPANAEYIVDMPKAKEILNDKSGSVLVDIRSWVEHIGETSGYDYIKPKGRPAGAIWGFAGSDPSNLQDFRNIDGTMRNGYEIENMWKQMTITRDKNLSFFCGTGWRAAEVLIYADIMGFEHISLYDGGWNEWSMDTKNPVETGEPTIKPKK